MVSSSSSDTQTLANLREAQSAARAACRGLTLLAAGVGAPVPPEAPLQAALTPSRGTLAGVAYATVLDASAGPALLSSLQQLCDSAQHLTASGPASRGSAVSSLLMLLHQTADPSPALTLHVATPRFD